MSLEGTIVNGAVVLDHPDALPEGTRVEVTAKSTTSQRSGLAERLLRHAGAVPDLPPDLADQHDHYLHGAPKR
jgi:hypothetical protein